MIKFILGLFCIATISAKSQTIIDTTNIWNVIECVDGGNCFTNTFQFGGDTTIGINQYKKIGYGAMREDTGKKFFYYDLQTQSERLMYDFSLNENDTFLSIMPCGDTFILVVDSIDSVTLLNGEKRKHYFFGSGGEEWIEGIGSTYGPTNVTFEACLYDTYEILLCFTNEAILKYHNANYDSCYFEAVGIVVEEKRRPVFVSPNPFQNLAKLCIPEAGGKIAELKIYNTKGAFVRSEKIPNITPGSHQDYTLHRGDLNNGMYFYELITKDYELLGNGKFIVD